MIKEENKVKSGIVLICLLMFATFALVGCKKEVVKPVVKPAEPPKQEEVFTDMEDQAAQALLEKVRAYAENFEVGGSDGDFKMLIKSNVPKGSLSKDVEEEVFVLIAPLIEDKIREKVIEGLKENTDGFTDEDVEFVLNEMNTGDLIEFVVNFEIERLVMEGYLR